MPSFFGDLNMNKKAFRAAGFELLAVAPTGPAISQIYFDTATTPGTLRMWNGTAWIDLSMILAGATTVRGEIANANTNPVFPATPATGDYYFITTTAGTVGGLTVEIGDQLVRSATSWFVVQANVVQATQVVTGFIRLATQAEANASALSDVAMSPVTNAAYLANVGYVRRFRTLVASLAAATATTVTHGLAVANPADVVVQISQGGIPIELDITFTTVNAFTITSNVALANVTVIVIG